VVIFSRQSNGNGDFDNLFSVSTPGRNQHLNSRSIISYHGMDVGSGLWKCSKDHMNDCVHIKIARDHLQKLITGDPAAMDIGGQALTPGTASHLYKDCQASLKRNSCSPYRSERGE
jgi:hypothetical protein